MKIQDIGAQPQIDGGDLKARRKETGHGAESFAGMLEQEALSGQMASTGIQNIEQPIPVESVRQLEGVTGSAEQKDCALAVDDMLGKLETLSGMLQQPNANAKEIDGLFNELKAAVAGFQEKVSGLPENDQLKDIGNEVNTLAYLESVKWDRGDYL